MKICTLASGSKGNCTLIQTDSVNILVDAGISVSEIEQKLQILEVEPKSIYAILITHEHSDHIKNVGAFARKYNCKVFAHENEWQILSEKIGELDIKNKIAFDFQTFYIQDLTINAFPLSHDCQMCVGYSFYNQGSKISIATDTGYPTKQMIESLKESNLIILEANHDEHLLLNNPKYSSILKKRILSNKGHLSNHTTAEVIMNIYSSNLKQVILAHLSEENNTPSLAYNTVKQDILKAGIVEGEHLYIDVASQHNLGNIFDLKN
ncbi:MAG: MBL fold metallo-hydrolase [Clostridiales bacterium]|nr:MBL fold metallo-hydrolase [Candidatus Apopatousia equi]